MQPLKAHFQNGQVVLDEPTDMPNGTELYVVAAAQLKGVDVGDDLDDEERAALHESIREGIEDMEAGRTIDAKTAIAQLRSRP
jgi:hypothetical protein